MEEKNSWIEGRCQAPLIIHVLAETPVDAALRFLSLPLQKKTAFI